MNYYTPDLMKKLKKICFVIETKMIINENENFNEI